MRLDDYLGFGATFAFGAWWVVFPRSVITLYTWFHRGAVRVPGEFGVRIAGAFWLAISAFVLMSFLASR